MPSKAGPITWQTPTGVLLTTQQHPIHRTSQAADSKNAGVLSCRLSRCASQPAFLGRAGERDEWSLGLALGKFRPGGLTTPDDLALSALTDHKAEVYFAGTDAVFELNDEYALPDDTCPYGVDVGR